jgi:hypothetical protein
MESGAHGSGKGRRERRCNIYGNEVVIAAAGGRTLVRCGEDPRLYTRRPLVGEWPPSPGG